MPTRVVRLVCDAMAWALEEVDLEQSQVRRRCSPEDRVLMARSLVEESALSKDLLAFTLHLHLEGHWQLRGKSSRRRVASGRWSRDRGTLWFEMVQGDTPYAESGSGFRAVLGPTRVVIPAAGGKIPPISFVPDGPASRRLLLELAHGKDARQR